MSEENITDPADQEVADLFAEVDAEAAAEEAPKKRGRKKADEENAVTVKEEKVLIKMDRHNNSYEKFGVKFTQTHPFALVSVDVANALCDIKGFRVATPREAQEYYN
jgi:hypothetical protein